MSLANRFRTLFGPGTATLFRSPRAVAIFLSSLLMMMNAQMISPLLPVLMDQYSVSESSIGLVMTALTAPPILFIPIIGPLTDRFPRRWVLATSLLIVGLAGLGIPFTATFEQLLGLRVVQGIGYSGVMPTTVTLLGDLYEGSVETTAQGIRSSMNNLASSILPVIAGAMLAISWKAPFFLYLATVPAALLVLVAIPSITGSGSQPSFRVYLRQVVQPLQDRRLIVLLWLGFVIFFVQYGFITYLPLLLVNQFGMSSALTGMYVGVAFAGGAVGASQAGRFVDRFSKPASLAVAFSVVGATLLAIPIVGVSRIVLFPTIALYGLCWGITSPTQRSMVNQSVDVSIRAGVNAMSYTLQNFGKAVAPLLVGVIVAATDYWTGFLLLSIAALAATAIILGFGVEVAD